ncbi:hypothetical protein D3H55_20055 [Bacillus salacetis]|uniref:Uncharacterized protein n=1 Tax=Bacillus salacetis TaxID=2315464 RepID=A0A3A1QTB0_9BACI|nr:hypothetical protein D3H55_20055 [Bacillus salacetis]
MNEEQDIIFKSVEEGVDLVEEANTSELVTEDVQKKVRACVVEMVRAAVRKNEVQLRTERDRKDLIAYLNKEMFKRPSLLWSYLWLKRQDPHILNSDSETAKDMPELIDMVKEDTPVDELENKEELYKLLLNPK